MNLFHFGTAKEPNNFYDETLDQIWIKGDNGQLVLMEDSTDENNKK